MQRAGDILVRLGRADALDRLTLRGPSRHGVAVPLGWSDAGFQRGLEQVERRAAYLRETVTDTKTHGYGRLIRKDNGWVMSCACGFETAAYSSIDYAAAAYRLHRKPSPRSGTTPQGTRGHNRARKEVQSDIWG